MSDVSLLAALGAGIASFVSPCVLPLVPAYLSFISGASVTDLVAHQREAALARRVALRSIIFVLGFSAVFITLGASATAIGAFLSEHLNIFAKIAAALVIVLGLHLTSLLPIKALYREKRFAVAGRPGGLLGAFVVGLAFAFGWTPCVGPILGSILALASTQGSVIKGIALLAVYSLGLGLPFIAAGIAVNSFLGLFNRVKRSFRIIEIVTGGLLILVGALMLTGGFERLSRYLTISLGG
jgi:cytochrome c-type biogenesis protein